MSAAQPLTLTQRLDHYRRQGGTLLTPRQRRRVIHKVNRAQRRECTPCREGGASR